MYYSIFLILLFDVLLGEPIYYFHPTVWIGKLIEFLEKLFYRQNGGFAKFAGFVVVVLTISIVGAIAYFAEYGFKQQFAPVYAHLFMALVASSAIAFRSLISHSLPILRMLCLFKLSKARAYLSKIVGRETQTLSRSETSRATIETLSESLGDGIISPLFYFAIFGLPGIYIYRAINTMDSMLGYKNERYTNFGYFAAKLDDIANYIPVRLCAIPSLIFSSIILRKNVINGIKCSFKEQSKHASPNAGWLEAFTAGALNIKLGGQNRYKNKVTDTAIFNSTGLSPKPKYILQCINLISFSLIFVVIELGILNVFSYFLFKFQLFTLIN